MDAIGNFERGGWQEPAMMGNSRAALGTRIPGTAGPVIGGLRKPRAGTSNPGRCRLGLGAPLGISGACTRAATRQSAWSHRDGIGGSARDHGDPDHSGRAGLRGPASIDRPELGRERIGLGSASGSKLSGAGGLPATVCLTADERTCLSRPDVAAVGWLVFRAEGSAAVAQPATPEAVFHSFQLPADISVTATRPAITFWPVARAGSTGTFELCDVIGAVAGALDHRESDRPAARCDGGAVMRAVRGVVTTSRAMTGGAVSGIGGFALVESLVATVIVSIGLLGSGATDPAESARRLEALITDAGRHARRRYRRTHSRES